MSDGPEPRGEADALRRARDEADRRYNEALTALDQSLRRLPDFPHSPPPFDSGLLARIDRLGAALSIEPEEGAGFRGAFRRLLWRMLNPLVRKQQAFNVVLADHTLRNAPTHGETAKAVTSAIVILRDELEALLTFESRLIQFLQQITPSVQTQLSILEHRLTGLQATATVAQRAAIAATRQLERLAQHATQAGPRVDTEIASGVTTQCDSGAYKYVAFEDLHRGSSSAIRERLRDYLALFIDQGPVLEIGCGRGEFLELLRAEGVEARGIDVNDEMVEVCRERGLNVEKADALSHMSALKPGSLGGFFAAQVVEHLEPAYLLRLLDTAADRLRPNGIIVLETINPTCWVAFFESYIRDLTHVRPLHPETLKYLLLSSGFCEIDVWFRSPVASEAKLQTVAVSSQDKALPGHSLDGLIAAFNANVQRLNERLFTYLDYAAIARRA